MNRLHKISSIKSSDAFKQMMKTVDRDKLADAMIKSGTGLAEVYQKSANALKAAEKGQNAAGIEAKDLAPKKDDPGLSSPVR